MTTWYQCQPRPRDRRQRWAFSVRPDLWPPGTVADVADTSVGWLANWDRSSSPPTSDNLPLVEYEVPGAAEALILAGLVEVDYEGGAMHRHWTEVSPPR